MIDATKITNYSSSDFELEEVILFWICAAGKNGVTAARCLGNLLKNWGLSFKEESPFKIIQILDRKNSLEKELKRFGIGCYTNKASFFRSLVYSGINLRTCSVDDLESIKGIGPKTARCFLIHSRRNQNYAGLDIHVLRFLKDQGHEVPKNTPTGKKYKELEKIFLQYVEKSNKTVADFDLEIWNNYRNRVKVK